MCFRRSDLAYLDPLTLWNVGDCRKEPARTAADIEDTGGRHGANKRQLISDVLNVLVLLCGCQSTSILAIWILSRLPVVLTARFWLATDVVFSRWNDYGTGRDLSSISTS